MNAERLQGWIDEIHTVSRQRWTFAVITFASPLLAVVAASAASGSVTRWFVVVIAAASAMTAARPDSHNAIVPIGLVVWMWISTVDDPLSPWSMLASTSLLLAHATPALMSITPHDATIDRTTVRRWMLRVGAMACVVVTTWTVAVGLDRRNADGNVTLLALALGSVVAATVLLRPNPVDRR